jgi:hypothetical protein
MSTAAACADDSAREAIDSERRVASLVVGSAAAEWGLLTIPRTGGTADLRPVVDPDSIVWNGATELPVVSGAWPLGDASVILLAEDGTLLRYDVPTDQATVLVDLSDDARVSGASSSTVVFVDSAGRSVLEVGGDLTHFHSLPEPAVWAGPIDGGVAVLTGADSSRLRLLQRADTAATIEIPDAGKPPALVTAWGRRVVVTGPSGRTVRIYSTEEEARLVGEVEVGGTVRALVASPSSHEIYVALESPTAVERLSRFSLETHSLGSLPAPADRMRPGLFGGSLLVRTSAGLSRIPIGEGEVTGLVGEWRSDLPIGLPGDLSIALVDDEARLVSVADTGGAVLAGGAPRWWIAAGKTSCGKRWTTWVRRQELRAPRTVGRRSSLIPTRSKCRTSTATNRRLPTKVRPATTRSSRPPASGLVSFRCSSRSRRQDIQPGSSPTRTKRVKPGIAGWWDRFRAGLAPRPPPGNSFASAISRPG